MAANETQLSVRASALDIEALGTDLPNSGGLNAGRDHPSIPRVPSQQDCCNVILAALTGGSIPADFEPNEYTNAFLEVLDHQLRRFSRTPIASEITLFLGQTEQSSTTHEYLVPVLYQLLAPVAIELASGATSVESIAGKIIEARGLSPSVLVPPVIYQCIFKFISLLTMLYTPADDPPAGIFQLASSNTREGTRQSYRRNSIWHHTEYEITEASIRSDFDHLLANFGNPIPPRRYPSQEIRHDLYFDMLIASNLNSHMVTKVGHLKIAWTNMLSHHLELHEPSSTLKLFAYPSFCAMLCSNIETQATFLSRLFAHGNQEGNMQSGAANPDTHAYSVDFMTEVLNSYRILFGQHKKSCRYFKIIRPTATPDPLLEVLCASPCHRGASKDFYQWLGLADSKAMYSASADFPLTGQRLLTLQYYMNNQNPSDLRTLWYDKRDVLRWYTFWAVFVVGGLSALSGVVSAGFTVVQVILTLIQ